MGKFLVAGIVQRETIVKVDRIPVEYACFYYNKCDKL